MCISCYCVPICSNETMAPWEAKYLLLLVISLLTAGSFISRVISVSASLIRLEATYNQVYPLTTTLSRNCVHSSLVLSGCPFSFQSKNKAKCEVDSFHFFSLLLASQIIFFKISLIKIPIFSFCRLNIC